MKYFVAISEKVQEIAIGNDKVESAEITSLEIAQLAMAGGGFDWLHESAEDDIYSDNNGEVLTPSN